jgi:hypothetical protein
MPFLNVGKQPVGLKTQNADFREKDILALKVNILITNNLQFIHGLSKMLISCLLSARPASRLHGHA